MWTSHRFSCEKAEKQQRPKKYKEVRAQLPAVGAGGFDPDKGARAKNCKAKTLQHGAYYVL